VWGTFGVQHLLRLEQGKEGRAGPMVWVEKERWDVACRTVEHLKEHGDKWRLDEELESPVSMLTRHHAHIRIQRKRDQGFWETYKEYLNSTEWKKDGREY
jgi:hypothetical protein